MAIGRLSVKVGKKGKASKHAQYIFREGKYAKSDELEDLEFKGHGNMPAWAEHSPNFFWKMADEHERKNGSTYREHEIALPRELTPSQRLELVRDWIAQEIGDKHAYQFAIHNPIALDGGEQPHVHLMFSDRLIDDIERDPNQYFKRYNSKHPERGGAKKANTAKLSSQRKQELKQQRQRWQILHNKHLQNNGFNNRITMKSYKDQGIRYKPLNIPMHKFKVPKFKQAYKEQLQHKKDFFELRRQRDEINVSQELERLNRESQMHEFELEMQDIEVLMFNREFIAESCGEFLRMTENNKFGSHDYVKDGHIFDEVQMKKLDEFTDIIKGYGSDWQSNVKHRINNADKAFFEEHRYILTLAQSPKLERDYRQKQEQQKNLDKSDLNSSAKNQDTNEKRATISNRRFRP